MTRVRPGHNLLNMSEHEFTNALAGETSPYLLQHAHNPVQWYPWGEEALRRAREEDRPILLSIGYSACHWCHVMERESFENREIADLMNRNFVNIKVDREERPDLDAIYMTAVQMMTGNGGWPMTVFLTPAQEPFYGGTYYPPEDRQGMPGFPRLLLNVARAYRENRDAILKDASAIAAALKETKPSRAAVDELTTEILDAAAAGLISGYDERNGGFGGAPKFPPAMALTFLLRSARRTGKGRCLEVVENTLTRMACGGVYDQLGGGFHRYSVDAHWLVPHFEKMLYDNALLSRIYLDTYLATGNAFYRRITEETLDYVLRDMTSPEGGFYSTQDADSEGHEGKYYVWTPREIEAVLGESDADLFCRYFDVSAEGNFEGLNVLNAPRSTDTVARLCRVSEDHLQRVIDRGKRALLEVRERRVKPGRDEKILTSWNALMMRSCAEAANALDREDYRHAAVRNAEFVLSSLRRDGRLLRTCRDGKAKYDAYLEDYACTIDGLISLYEASFEPRWVREAEDLAHFMTLHFWDNAGTGFFLTSDDHEQLIQRPKEYYDNATPCGNSVAAYALLRLGRLTGEDLWTQPPLAILKSMALPMSRYPSAFSNLLCALDFYLSGPREIAIVGSPGEKMTRQMLSEIFRRYLPNKIVACGLGGDLLLKNRPQIKGLPTAYVCRNNSCAPPVTTPGELAAQIE